MACSLGRQRASGDSDRKLFAFDLALGKYSSSTEIHTYRLGVPMADQSDNLLRQILEVLKQIDLSIQECTFLLDRIDSNTEKEAG